jgi:hypothetical protein
MRPLTAKMEICRNRSGSLDGTLSGLGFSASAGHPKPPFSLSGEGKVEYDNGTKMLAQSINARQ